jgi:hypothetical protein
LILEFFHGVQRSKKSQLNLLVAATANQALWITKLMADLYLEQQESTQLFMNDQTAILISNDPVLGLQNTSRLSFSFREKFKRKEK